MLALASRSTLRSVALCLLAAAALAGFGGCTHAGGKVPVDSPVYAFQPVDPDDYAPADAEDTGGAADDSGE